MKFRSNRDCATLIRRIFMETNMANLTISVSDEVLKRARIRALKENRSVNAMLGQYLEEYAQMDEVQRRRQQALQTVLTLAAQCRCGRNGKTWSRDELHER